MPMHRCAHGQLKFNTFRPVALVRGGSAITLKFRHLPDAQFISATAPPLCPRVGGFRYVSGRGRLPLLRHLVLEVDPVPRRNTEQISRAPDDVILELADLAVR